jgi:hypothetical protein
MFGDHGMSEIAEHHWWPLPVLADRQGAGWLWVAADETDAPVAFLMADLVDGCLHVEQSQSTPAALAAGWGAGCWTTPRAWRQLTVFPH